MNECLLPYKDRHAGQTGLCFGTGPTVKEFPNEIPGVKFGSNEIIHLPYKMDYYFIGDQGSPKRGYLSNKEAYETYKPNIQKFYRRMGGRNTRKGMPPGLDALYYDTGHRLNTMADFSADLTEKFKAWGTITMEVIQFMVYTGIRKIILVGHDCNYNNGTFNSKKDCHPGYGRLMLQIWKTAQKWLESMRVDVKIINPVSLNLFKVYE